MMAEASRGQAVPVPMAMMQSLLGLQGLQLASAQVRQYEIASKLQWLFLSVGRSFGPATVSVFQAWLPMVGPVADDSADVNLCCEPALVVCDPRFQEFRTRSMLSPLQYKNSMPGRVWRTGAVQVVQNLKIVPPSLHPRSQLREEDLDSLAEVMYIPVHDCLRPASSPVAVLEAFMSARSPNGILAADFLSFVNTALSVVQLSVSSPMPQPIRRSALCGRRARAPTDSNPDMQHEAAPQPASVPVGVSTSGTQPQPAEGAQQAQPLITGARQAQPAGTQGIDCAAGQEEADEPCSKVRRVGSGGMTRSKSMAAVAAGVPTHVGDEEESDEEEGTTAGAGVARGTAEGQLQGAGGRPEHTGACASGSQGSPSHAEAGSTFTPSD